LGVFKNDTQNNFSQVLAAVQAINVDVNLTDFEKLQKLRDIYNAVKDQAGAMWILDYKNPTYSLGSGVNNWVAVDTLSSGSAYVVANDGNYQYWDGVSWTYGSYPGVIWHGVGMLQASTPYAWLVGEDAGNAVYSVNGAPPQVFAETNDSIIYDVKIVESPNNPGNVTVFLVSDTGLYSSDDFGVIWTLLEPSGSEDARMSNIIANNDLGATNGYRFAQIEKSTSFYYWNGTEMIDEGLMLGGPAIFKDVVMVEDGVAYIVGTDSGGKNVVWKFTYNQSAPWADPSQLTEVYSWANASSAAPVGIAASSIDDVWVATNNPSVMYHFDGNKWEYQSFPYARSLIVMLGFGNSTALSGLHDVSMSDGYSGFSVGDDGLIIKYQKSIDTQLDLLANLTAQINASRTNLTPVLSVVQEINFTTQQTLSIVQGMNLTLLQINQAIDGNFTVVNSKLDALNLSDIQEQIMLSVINSTVTTIKDDQVLMQQFLNASIHLRFDDVENFLSFINVTTININDTVTQINSAVFNMNSSIIADLSAVSNKIDQMNASIQYKIDNVLNNVTYTQLYLETTLFPMVNATYQNTLLILQDLGIIKAQINETIQLQNATLNIVNSTDQKVDQLLNSSKRIRAWVTQ
jgi:hypothetical protein